jgi:hypothetical protein
MEMLGTHQMRIGVRISNITRRHRYLRVVGEFMAGLKCRIGNDGKVQVDIHSTKPRLDRPRILDFEVRPGLFAEDRFGKSKEHVVFFCLWGCQETIFVCLVDGVIMRVLDEDEDFMGY